MLEITIKVKGEDSTFTKKIIEYDALVTMSLDDKTLKAYVEAAIDECKFEPDEVSIRTLLFWS